MENATLSPAKQLANAKARCRKILRTSQNAIGPHIEAVRGEWKDFVRAADRSFGDICHYAAKGKLYYVENPVRQPIQKPAKATAA